MQSLNGSIAKLGIIVNVWSIGVHSPLSVPYAAKWFYQLG